MREHIVDLLLSIGLAPKTLILLMATLPVTELRASIPVGVFLLKQSVGAVFFYSVIGNILPIAPIYFLLEPVTRLLSGTERIQRFFEWLFRRARKRSGLIERYEAIGLMIFVSIPFPGTGVWTGCLIASLLRMRFIPVFLASSAGVIIAAIVVTALTLMGKMVF